MWKKQSKVAVTVSPLVSSAAALVAWLLKAHSEYGEITITSLSGNLPLVAGNMMSLCGPLVLTPLLTFIRPEDFDWNVLKEKIRPDVDPSSGGQSQLQDQDYKSQTELPPVDVSSAHQENSTLLRSRKRSIVASITLTLILLVIWPIPMYASRYVFSKGFFTGWVVVLFLWAFFAASTITLIPVWEGRGAITKSFRAFTGQTEKEVLIGVPVDSVEVVGSATHPKA